MQISLLFPGMKTKNRQILTLWKHTGAAWRRLPNHPERSVSIMDFTNLPLGFVMGIAMHENAMNAYSRLTEAEKEKIIFECRDAKGKSDMDKIINRLSGRLI